MGGAVIPKIATRIYGELMHNLLKSTFLVCKNHDFVSFNVFRWAFKIYFCGGTCLGALKSHDLFDILAMQLDDECVNVGPFRFVFIPKLLPSLVAQCDDILAESVLSHKLGDYYRLFGKEGPYEVEEVSLNEKDFVIDAGANMGVFSVYAASRGVAKVYAFEPVKQLFSILSKNITVNNYQDQIEIIPIGLSNRNGLQTISFSEDALDGASLVFHEQQLTEAVPCMTLDDWVKENNIPRIDFIKADIEGAERYLLSGAQETLKKFKPRLAICTYHLPDDPQVLERLIKEAVPEYRVIQRSKKLFAYVPDEMKKNERSR